MVLLPVAWLLALSKRDPALFRQVFDRVVDNGRTLRTLVQFVRSGQFGRKSLSYALQRAVQRWLNTASVEKLLSASIGSLIVAILDVVISALVPAFRSRVKAARWRVGPARRQPANTPEMMARP